MKPFNKKDQATVTFQRKQDGTIVINKNQAVSNLIQIQENNDEDQNGDDDYYAPTEMPQVLMQADISYNKYITSNTTAIDTQTLDQSDYIPKTVQDFQQNYILSEDGKALYLKDIAEIYQSDFKDNDQIMIKRCMQHQNILQFQQSDTDNLQNIQEGQMIDYLKMHSKLFQNAISISEIARGGESVVYKLDHLGVDEVVIKQSVTDTNNKIDEVTKQSVLTNQMGETQQLKLLQSDKFIAQVKEEIIEYDVDNNIIKNYLVVVERARFSLKDLLKIWNNQELSDKFYEYYSPEKLAYYFYQTIQIMAYLHQRDVYYGDMKPHNLLVFKDQLIKIGDLGTTIKLDHNIQEDQKAYFIKGLSLAYQDLKTFDKWRRKVPQSKNDLFEIDKYSLIRTFYQCIQETKQIKYDSGNSNICQQMFDDLVEGKSLKFILQKFSKIFVDSADFFTKLLDQMKSENKIEAIVHIGFLSKYKVILENQLYPLLKNYENSAKGQLFEDTRLDELDQLNGFYNMQDFLPFYEKNLEKQIQSYMNDLEFKNLLIDIMKSIKHLLLPNAMSIIQTKDFYNILNPYFGKNGEISGYIQNYDDLYSTYKPKDFINTQQHHIVVAAEFYNLISAAQELEYFIDIVMEIRLDPEVNLREQLMKQISMGLLQLIGEAPDRNNLIEFQKVIDQFKLKSSQDIRNKMIAYYIKALVELGKLQEAQILCKEFAIEDLYQRKEFFTDNYVDIAFEYFKLLKIQNRYNEAIILVEGWLQKYRDLCGDSHEITLRLYGFLGELLLERKTNEQEQIQGINYLTKYSKINIHTYTHFLMFLENHNMVDTIRNHLPPYFSVRHFNQEILSNIYSSVFLGTFEEEAVINSIKYIYQEMINDQERDHGSDLNIEFLKSQSIG
eukprot:403339846